MSIVIDIVLAFIFLTLMICFAKYGFTRTVFSIGKSWLSFICAFGLGPLISGPIHNWFLGSAFTGGVKNTLVALVEKNPNGYNLAQLFENLPDGLIRFLGAFNISIPDLEAEYGSATVVNDGLLQALAERIAEPCASAVSTIIGYILGIVIPAVFFWWFSRQIRKRRNLLFLYLDHITGFVIGTALGYCSVLGVSFLLHTVFQAILAFDANSAVMLIYEKSYIFRFVNEFDLWGAIRGFLS